VELEVTCDSHAQHKGSVVHRHCESCGAKLYFSKIWPKKFEKL